MTCNEKEIIRCLGERNEAAMKMIFDDYYRMLLLYSLQFVPTADDAEDVVQEVLVSFWQTKKGCAFTGSVKAYLFGAVRRSSASLLKKAGRHIATGLDPALTADDFENYYDNEISARQRMVERAVEKLPEKCREVFISIVLDNLKYKEVAEKLDISVNTVKTHYLRALKQLRSSLHTFFFLIF